MMVRLCNRWPLLGVTILFGLAGQTNAQGSNPPGAKDRASPSARVQLLRTIAEPRYSPGKPIYFADRARELIAAGADGVHAWDVKTGALRHTWPATVSALAVSPEGTTLAVIDSCADVSLLHVPSRKRLWQFRFTGKKDPYESDSAVLALSPDGKLLAVHSGLEVELWHLSQRKLLHRLERDTGWSAGAVQFFPDGKSLLVTGFPTYLGTVWNVASGKRERSVLLLKYTGSVALSPDGYVVAAGVSFGSWHALSFFRASREGVHRELRLAMAVNGVAFSRDGRLLAAACDEGKVLLLHAKSFQVAATITTAEVRHLSATFSPDGRLLAVGSADGRVRLWDIDGLWKKLPEYEQLPAERLEHLWRELAKPLLEDNAAVYQLLAVPEQTVPFFAAKLKPAGQPEAEQLARLIRDLDSPRFAERESATRKLEALHWLCRPALEQALAQQPGLETRRRIEKLLERMQRIHDPDGTRQWRAVGIVSSVRTPPALRLLESWAKGAPGAYLTQEAQRRLKELKEREQGTR
jgi:hypothetical protein